MSSSHIAFASTAITNSPSPSHAVASGSTIAGHPPLPPTTSPIAVSQSAVDSAHPRTYYYNLPSDYSTSATVALSSNGDDHTINGHIASAISPAAAAAAAAVAAATTTAAGRTAPSRQDHHTSFSPSSLPRTSSLLPPPRLLPTRVATRSASPSRLLRPPFPATAANASLIDSSAAALVHPTTTSPSPQQRRPSRSSSVSGLHESLRNLNRWSASTASSRASVSAGAHPLFHRHQRSASFSRRFSVDSIGLQNQASDLDANSATPSASSSGQLQQTPRKLHKSRPSTSGGGSPLRSSPGALPLPRSPARIPPLESLPPIIALPSLEQEVQGGSAALSNLAAHQRRPSLRRAPSEDSTHSFYFGDAPAAPLEAFDETQEYDSPPRSRTSTIATGAAATMQYDREPPPPDGAEAQAQTQAAQSRGPSRTRPRNTSNAQSSTDSTRRDRSNRPPSQKAMLSRALQKANTAVQLDNAGNNEGARLAYAEACDLLHQVLLKTQGEDDKRKLEAIRVTYTARIEELDQIVPSPAQDTRPLPKRPSYSSVRRKNSVTTYADDNRMSEEDEEEDDEVVIRTATVTRIYNEEEHTSTEPRSVPGYSVPLSASPMLIPPSESSKYGSPLLTDQYTLQSSFSRSPRRDSLMTNGFSNGSTTTLHPPPTASQYMPPPLSPRRIPSPAKPSEDVPVMNGSGPGEAARPTASRSTATLNNVRSYEHVRDASVDSWLDPIDESGDSGASSVHSRTSSMAIRRKHIRAASGATEAEFDAALDDAIEAAYDEGYEPMSAVSTDSRRPYGDDDVLAQTMRKVELAKKRVRETEREAMEVARQLRERQLSLQQAPEQPLQSPRNFFDSNDESEDEEHMLEGMTNGYAIEDFAFGAKSTTKPLPRESDSSEFTNRTWHSSMASNPPTASTTLSTVTENSVLFPALAKGVTSTMPPPPTQALPRLPPQSQSQSQSPSQTQSQSPVRGDSALSVRSRRLSGQNPKQLKIETSKLGPPGAPPQGPFTDTIGNVPASAFVQQPPRTAGFLVQQRQALSASQARPGSSTATGSSSLPFGRQAAVPSPALGGLGETVPQPSFPPPTPPIPHATPFGEHDNGGAGRASSPSGKPALRKNFSSSSLRSMRGRNMSVSNYYDDGSDMSPGTPLSSQFALNRLPAIPTLPTPVAVAFKDRMNAGSGLGGMRLLESDFHSPSSPGSPNPIYSDAPVPLESCPTDTMLRPFWLMRCLYQTLVHPRGGYISNKLFVPSDVWKVKNVRLKNIEEKVGNCDLLTAALLKLARVDTCDADAVLEEMQSLEGVLEQVQTVLTRRLGNEVGVQSTTALFKEASTGIDHESGSAPVPRTSSVSGNRSFSWRRLRSKNSSAGLGNNYATNGRKESISEIGPKDSTLASLPMTSHPTSKPVKRDVASAKFTGPHANYMGALARLFDAAQSIDQIARQVEDPGLRHADKTQVGLELCTRHAAEFFAFYICRFVLSDMSLLLEKFIKRGSEWVLA